MRNYTDNYLLKPYHPVTVFIIGAGGTGSQVITNLARMDTALQASGHPGLHVTLFDPDTVTQANIGRQLFSETELGMNKAIAAVTRINRFFGTAWMVSARVGDGGRSPAVILRQEHRKTGMPNRSWQTLSLPARTMYGHGSTCGDF